MPKRKLFLSVVVSLCWMARWSMAAVPPATNFDLSHWKLTLPIDASGGITNVAKEIKQPALQTYTSQFFYTDTDGAMVFWCPVQGATTSGADAPRSELRELLDPSDSDVNWTGNGTHILRAQCKVTQQPDTGAVIIGQVHGYPEQRLVKLQYDGGQLQAYVRNSLTASGDTKFTYTVSPGVMIDYEIKVVDGVAYITVNGVTKSHDFFASDAAWKDSTFYFKAGAYLQDNSGPDTEGGRVSFYQLSVIHGETVQVAPTISSQPVSRSVNEGSAVNFAVVADGSPLLAYEWRKDGVKLPNVTNSALAFVHALTNDAANYTVVVTNSFGSVTSAPATLTVVATNISAPPSPPAAVVALADALDAAGLSWTTNGTPAWAGQTNVAHDGSDAAQSGAIANGKTTSIQTVVQGPGVVSFWWKVSSEPSNDRLLFYIGSKEQARITGEVDWQWRTFNISSGTQTLKWTYSKNSSKTGGLDRAWLDQVQVGAVPPAITTQPVSAVVDAGKSVMFTVVANGTAPLSYRWLFNGAPLSDDADINGATTAKLNISNVQLPWVGTYSVVVSNTASNVTSAVVTLALSSNVTIEQALDSAGETYTSGGTGQPWRGQQAVAHDGADAAQSGAVSDSTYTWIKTTVSGPKTLTFWWKVSSEKDHDYLRFMLDGTDQTKISGEVDWRQVTFNVPSGSHELQWRYSKNSSSVAGQDRGWLDQVQLGAANFGFADSSQAVFPAFLPAVTVSENEALLTWNSVPGRLYQVFYKDSLLDSDWIMLAGSVEATGFTCSVLDNSEASQRFYQVVEE
jgi:hypothetical protein